MSPGERSSRAPRPPEPWRCPCCLRHKDPDAALCLKCEVFGIVFGSGPGIHDERLARGCPALPLGQIGRDMKARRR